MSAWTKRERKLLCARVNDIGIFCGPLLPGLPGQDVSYELGSGAFLPITEAARFRPSAPGRKRGAHQTNIPPNRPDA